MGAALPAALALSALPKPGQPLSAPEVLVAKTREVALRPGSGATTAQGYMNENVGRAIVGKVGERLDLQVPRHVPCGHTEGHHEATKGFAAKHAPAFKGRQTALFSRHGIMAHGIR